MNIFGLINSSFKLYKARKGINGHLQSYTHCCQNLSGREPPGNAEGRFANAYIGGRPYLSNVMANSGHRDSRSNAISIHIMNTVKS